MSPDAPATPVIPARHYLRRGRRLPRDVADLDIELLFSVIGDTRDRAKFLLMLRSGLRVGEVRNLDLSDLYLQTTGRQLPRIWVRGKGGCERMAFVSGQTLAILEHWLALWSRAGSQTEAVFLNRFGRRFSVTGIQYRLAHYCEQVGLWITCHQLRHVFARHLVEAGIPVTSIQRMLGHARLKTTEIYLHISDPQVQADYRQALVAFNARLQLDWEGAS
ncbi:MAG: tyrosine-type recombinase/integrase [Anaerolineales bacterium]|nr:tyrosine-type recombinase/integrase [Anaerolineales bacterium]MCB0028927.1 tyrosine-type recombinase/integrase [Anaerolineales bacterium]